MTEHVETLVLARERMVKARRDLAVSLSKAYDGRVTPQQRASFLEVQSVIDVIDRAIADEGGLTASIYDLPQDS